MTDINKMAIIHCKPKSLNHKPFLKIHIIQV